MASVETATAATKGETMSETPETSETSETTLAHAPVNVFAENIDLFRAIAEVQWALENVEAEQVGRTQNRSYLYANLPSVMKELRPHLKEHSLLITHELHHDAAGDPFIVTYVIQSTTGQFHKWETPVFYEKSMKSVGSAETYARRYNILMAFNIAVGADDDDGTLAGDQRPPQRQEAPKASQPAAPKPAETPESKPALDALGQWRDICITAATARAKILVQSGYPDSSAESVIRQILRANNYAKFADVPEERRNDVLNAIKQCLPVDPAKQEETDRDFSGDAPQGDPESEVSK